MEFSGIKQTPGEVGYRYEFIMVENIRCNIKESFKRRRPCSSWIEKDAEQKYLLRTSWFRYLG